MSENITVGATTKAMSIPTIAPSNHIDVIVIVVGLLAFLINGLSWMATRKPTPVIYRNRSLIFYIIFALYFIVGLIICVGYGLQRQNVFFHTLYRLTSPMAVWVTLLVIWQSCYSLWRRHSRRPVDATPT
jgi:hypothetical protein